MMNRQTTLRFLVNFFSSTQKSRPAEEETSGLARRLDEQLAPVEEDPNSYGPGGMSAGSGGDWEIGDCLAQWWRPSFETFMVSG